MSDKMSRREFVVSTTAGVAAAAAPGLGQGTSTMAQAPAVKTRTSSTPIVVSSANGHSFKNGGDMTAVQKAFSMIASGADVLEALIAGVNIVELDPAETSVGYGGLPDADGVVQLDSCCMHGPLRRGGGGAGIQGGGPPPPGASQGVRENDYHPIAGKGG